MSVRGRPEYRGNAKVLERKFRARSARDLTRRADLRNRDEIRGISKDLTHHENVVPSFESVVIHVSCRFRFLARKLVEKSSRCSIIRALFHCLEEGILLRDRLMVGLRTLDPSILVRIQVPQPFRSEQTQNFPTTTFAHPAPQPSGDRGIEADFSKVSEK